MRNVKLTGLAIIAILSLILTGCYKIVNVATVSYDGKLTGSFTFTLPIENADLNQSATFVSESRETTGPLEVLSMSYDEPELSFVNINNCVVGYMKMEIPAGNYGEFFNFVIVTQPETLEGKLYATGWAYYENSSNDGTIFTVEVNLIPESGDAADCAQFDEVTTGEIHINPNFTNGSIGLGSVQMPAIAQRDVGLYTLQLSNLPMRDRLAYQTITQLFSRNSHSSDDLSLDWTPESKQCWNYLKSEKFNKLNNRTFESGEFLALINATKRMKVSYSSKILTITCKYSNVDLWYADRSVNEYPWQSESFNPMGFWYKADESLIWEYKFRDQNRMMLDSIRSDGYYTVNDLNKKDNLNSHDEKMYNYLKNVGTSHKIEINGVVLGTNANFDKAKNSVTFSAGGVATSNEDYWLIEDSIKPGADYLNALIGQAVLFDSGKKSIATSQAKLVEYAKILKKNSSNRIRLVGIYDGAITNESVAATNQELVENRLSLLKNKLKKLGVKASFINGFVLDEQPRSGDPKAKSKVVIQVIPDR